MSQSSQSEDLQNVSSKLKPLLPTNAASVPHTKYIFRQEQGVCEAAFGAALATAGRDKGLAAGFSNMQTAAGAAPGEAKVASADSRLR